MTETNARLTELVDKLKAQGHRITPQRMAVLKAFVESAQHPSVEQVYERVRADFPMTSLATVYKTVSLLKEMGEILELGFSDDSNHYDANRPYPHPHLVCIRCKKVVDLDAPTLASLPDALAQATGYQVVSHRLDVFGVCPQCQEENPSS